MPDLEIAELAKIVRPAVNFEEDNNKVPMNKPYNIQNTNICNGIFHISFFKALLIIERETTGANGNRGETTQRGERDSGRNIPDCAGIIYCT